MLRGRSHAGFVGSHDPATGTDPAVCLTVRKREIMKTVIPDGMRKIARDVPDDGETLITGAAAGSIRQ